MGSGDWLDPSRLAGAFAVSAAAGVAAAVAVSFSKRARSLMVRFFRWLFRCHPAPPATGAPSSRLLATDGFVGRKELLKELEQDLKSETHRVIVLYGPRFVGKSWVASFLAQRVRRRFGDPLRLDCRAGIPPDVMLSRAARFVGGVDEERIAARDENERIDLVLNGAAGGRRLLIFDSAEDVATDPVYQRFFTAFANSSHRSCLILTSRERLECVATEPGYRQEPVDGLGPGDGAALLAERGLNGTDADRRSISIRFAGSAGHLDVVARTAVDRGLNAAHVLADSEFKKEGGAVLAGELSRVRQSILGSLLPFLTVLRLPVAADALLLAASGSAPMPASAEIQRALERGIALGFVEIESTHVRPSTVRYSLHSEVAGAVREWDFDWPAVHRIAAGYWLSLPVPEGLDARTIDDVQPIIEAHHHLLAAGDVGEAVAVTSRKRFGVSNEEDVTEFLSRRGLPRQCLAIEEASAQAADRSREPELWAQTRNNLGIAYRQLGSVDGPESLRKAVAAYEEALDVRTRKDYPANWAGTKNNLGIAYGELGSVDGPASRKKAVAAYEGALEVYTRQDYPADWATTKNNLGSAYQELGSVDGPESLRKAVAAYEDALEVRTRQDYPANWATTKNDLGTAYGELGSVDGPESLRKGVAAYKEALQVFTREDYPVRWAMTKNNLGNAYGDLASVDGPESTRKAIGAYEGALAVYTREDYPLHHERITAALVATLAMLEASEE